MHGVSEITSIPSKFIALGGPEKLAQGTWEKGTEFKANFFRNGSRDGLVVEIRLPRNAVGPGSVTLSVVSRSALHQRGSIGNTILSKTIREGEDVKFLDTSLSDDFHKLSTYSYEITVKTDFEVMGDAFSVVVQTWQAPLPANRVDAERTNRMEETFSNNPRPRPSDAPAEREGNLYIVKQGDYLKAIAVKYYGNSQKWKPIYEANKGIIGPNPDRLMPGQRLVIPNL